MKSRSVKGGGRRAKERGRERKIERGEEVDDEERTRKLNKGGESV